MALQRVILIAVLVGLGTTGAQAQGCVGPDDLANGVRLTFSNGTYETYRHLDTGMTEVDVYSGTTGGRVRMQLASGLFLVSQFEILDVLDTPILQRKITYAGGLDALVVPTEPGVSAMLRTSVHEPDYGVNDAGITLTTTAHPDVTLGGCTYAALGVELRYGAVENWPEELENLVYFPSLRFGYLAGYQSGDDPVSEYLLVNIMAVK